MFEYQVVSQNLAWMFIYIRMEEKINLSSEEEHFVSKSYQTF